MLDQVLSLGILLMRNSLKSLNYKCFHHICIIAIADNKLLLDLVLYFNIVTNIGLTHFYTNENVFSALLVTALKQSHSVQTF